MFPSIFLLAKNYCLNCNIHGMRYLAEPGRHWMERIFWMICCLLSWWASIYLMKESWHDFTGDSAVSFSVETESTMWNTEFPSITVCESLPNHKLLSEKYINWVEETFQEEIPDIKKIMIIIAEIRYFDGTGNHYRFTCEEMFLDCYWNGRKFNCCEYFHPLWTEKGPCFSINNLNTKGKRLDMTSNTTTGPGNLTVYTSKPGKHFITPPQDVPQLGDQLVFSTSDQRRIMVHFSVTEVVSDALVRDAKLSQRQCRFPDENTLTFYDRYNFYGCIVECRNQAYIRKCNCTTALMPNVGYDVCDIYGYKCITSYINGLGWRQLRPIWDVDGEGIYCDCMLNCNTMDIRLVFQDSVKLVEREGNGMEFYLVQLPTERYKRVMVRTLLDLVVNIGGTLGLLMGASILSIVEVIHYFLLPLGRVLAKRMFGDAADGRFCRGAPQAARRVTTPKSALAALPLRRTRVVARTLNKDVLTDKDAAKAFTIPSVLNMKYPM